MSDGTNFYNKLLGYVLWIKRQDGSIEQRQILRTERLILPKSGKKYKITLRNLKLYLEELAEVDSTIVEVCIDRLARVGIISW